MIRTDEFDAAILDLDGVITRTAALHARVWKQLFDEFLVQRQEPASPPSEPFDIDRDYRQYIDGKPRYDGVRSFLEARGIELPEGQLDDPPGRQTVYGLGNRKNELFQALLERDGVHVYDDAVAQIRRWRQRGWKTAVVSSSKNGARVLVEACLTDLFDVRVDGEVAQRLRLEGKPRPDIFLEAARQLKVPPSRAIVVEDAVAGVEAGKAGGFGVVVGVARHDEGDRLRAHGADVTVQELTQLDDAACTADPLARVVAEKGERRLAVFLDYDGTLTPIVERPEDARLTPEMREVLQQLAGAVTVAIVSGRDRGDVEQLVQLSELYYAGSHGFDISGPGGMHSEQEQGQACLPALDQAERELRDQLASVPGVQVERKRFAIAIHYRRAAAEDLPSVERIVDDARDRHPKLRKRDGKKIFELQPDIPWDKGRAVLWLLETLELDQASVLPIYLGDDVTDEDAFAALEDRGLGILVGEAARTTRARCRLQDTEEVRQFLQALLPVAETAGRADS